MSEQLTVHEDANYLRHVAMLSWNEPRLERLEIEDNLALARLGGGVIRLAQSIYPCVDMSDIYAELREREPKGQGPHFDVYPAASLDAQHPWIGVYNVSGKVALKATVLESDLHEAYNRRYPEPSEDAYKARRDFSAIAFGDPGAEIYTALLGQGDAMVIAQAKNSPALVHEVEPLSPSNPGSFIKLAVPAKNSYGTKLLEMTGMKPLDELLTYGDAEIQEATKPVVPESAAVIAEPLFPRRGVRSSVRRRKSGGSGLID